MAKYFGRDGRPVDAAKWATLRGDASYRIIREYRNDDVWVTLEWSGAVLDPTIFRDCWPMFFLLVRNARNGNWVHDPVENGKTFAYEADGIKAYEAFLERWTASHRNEEGDFVEEDNELTPPPPPDPDAPSSSVAKIKGVDIGDGDIGAW